MNDRSFARVWPVLLLISALPIACVHQSPATTASNSPHQEPPLDVSRLRAALEDPLSEPLHPKSAWSERQGRLVAVLFQSPSECDNALRFLSSDAAKSDSGFAQSLSYGLLWALIARGDDDRLCALLSQVPMEETGPDGWYL